MNGGTSFIEMLKAFRIEHGYTQYDLAEYLGYAEDTITARSNNEPQALSLADAAGRSTPGSE